MRIRLKLGGRTFRLPLTRDRRRRRMKWLTAHRSGVCSLLFPVSVVPVQKETTCLATSWRTLLWCMCIATWSLWGRRTPGGVMVWAGISHSHKTAHIHWWIFNCWLIQNHCFKTLRPNVTYQHTNRCHVSLEYAKLTWPPTTWSFYPSLHSVVIVYPSNIFGTF